MGQWYPRKLPLFETQTTAQSLITTVLRDTKAMFFETRDYRRTAHGLTAFGNTGLDLYTVGRYTKLLISL